MEKYLQDLMVPDSGTHFIWFSVGAHSLIHLFNEHAYWEGSLCQAHCQMPRPKNKQDALVSALTELRVV